MIDMMWILGIAHTLQLCHIDLLGKILVKSVIKIKLAKAPLAMECNVKHSTDNDEIDQWTEIPVKINAWLLVKTFRNKTSFIQSNRAIGTLFNAKKTHLLPIMLCHRLGGMRDRVLSRMRASYSSCMA